jgi:hypothetical protein
LGLPTVLRVFPPRRVCSILGTIRGFFCPMLELPQVGRKLGPCRNLCCCSAPVLWSLLSGREASPQLHPIALASIQAVSWWMARESGVLWEDVFSCSRAQLQILKSLLRRRWNGGWCSLITLTSSVSSHTQAGSWSLTRPLFLGDPAEAEWQVPEQGVEKEVCDTL